MTTMLKLQQNTQGASECRERYRVEYFERNIPDQHWVNAQTRYYLEWLIETKHAQPGSVLFYGQDDKARIPVGNDVAVSTNVRSRTRAIVPHGVQPSAADHDFGYASIIPSVTLKCNIPDSMERSFFGGDGEMEVVLRDGTFDGSDVFDHCSQLLQTLSNEPVKPFGIVLQTDGGPDHNLTFLRTRLALVSLFISGDMDILVAIRGAPNGSWLNKAERCMSILNLGLQDVALIQGVMPEWAEDHVKSASSMKDVRKIAESLEKETKAARDRANKKSGGAPRLCCPLSSSDASRIAIARQGRANDLVKCGFFVGSCQGRLERTSNACVVIALIVAYKFLAAPLDADDIVNAIDVLCAYAGDNCLS